MSKVLRPRIVRTNKPHDCFGCGRAFPARTRMECSTIADSGSLWTCYLCETCQEITNSMADCDEYGYGDLLEDALELEKEKLK